MQGQDDGQDHGRETGKDEALRARLERLSDALHAQSSGERGQEGGEAAEKAQRTMGQAISLGFRVMTEFVAAILVGGVVGWQLDQWLGTSPILLVILLGFGTAAGFWNVYRIAVPDKNARGGLM